MKLFNKLFKRTDTVDSVMSGFIKSLSRLDSIVQTQTATAESKSQEVTRLNAEITAHSREAVRASNVSKRINALIS